MLLENTIHLGDCLELMKDIPDASVSLSFWSPPYHVGKAYERNETLDEWLSLLTNAVRAHFRVLEEGGFMVINIADILAYSDSAMPRFMASVPEHRRSGVTKEAIESFMSSHPEANRKKIASALGCSEQTVDRRLRGNNIRGGKISAQTRVRLVGHVLEEAAMSAGLYLYDRRIWLKDPTWQTNRWHSSSYRSVSEFEDLYFFWKPGVSEIKRSRLNDSEWGEWGSRQVWKIASVRENVTHPAQFPLPLALRVVRLLSGIGDLVIDPFAGSGTTAVACKQTGRRYLCIEKDRDYWLKACERVNQSSGIPSVSPLATHTVIEPNSDTPLA